MVDISSWQSALLHGLLQLPNPNSGVQIASQQEAWCVAGPRGLSLHSQGVITLLLLLLLHYYYYIQNEYIIFCLFL